MELGTTSGVIGVFQGRCPSVLEYAPYSQILTKADQPQKAGRLFNAPQCNKGSLQKTGKIVQ
jgi:hypothetical protein